MSRDFTICHKYDIRNKKLQEKFNQYFHKFVSRNINGKLTRNKFDAYIHYRVHLFHLEYCVGIFWVRDKNEDLYLVDVMEMSPNILYWDCVI